MDQCQRLNRKANLGGSEGDVDGTNGGVVWKGMEGFTGLHVPDSAGAACGDQLPTAAHSQNWRTSTHPRITERHGNALQHINALMKPMLIHRARLDEAGCEGCWG